VEETGGRVVIATTATEMRQAKHEGKVALLLSLEGARPIGDRLELLRLLYRLGVRRFQLTHNRRNQIADGCGEERTHSGITEFGVTVLSELNRLGMILDLAHLSQSSFWAALEHHEGPVVVSHANAAALCDHPRNLTDQQIAELGRRGGVVGIAFMDFFISKGQPTIRRLVDHIDHIAELVGIDHVGLGCDYIYLENGESTTYPPGLTSHSEVHNLTAELVRRGYSNGEIRRILGENFLRVFEQILGA
jgi:membrane dipeptidase